MPCLEEEHAQALTLMPTRGYSAFCQEARRAPEALRIFGPSHACENACGRQRLGSGSGGLRDASDPQAPGEGGAPGGPQPQLPPSGRLSSLPPLCPGSGAQMRWRCLHMKQQSMCDFQGPHLCLIPPPAPCFEPRLQEDVITAKLCAGLRVG